jgi:hypothetical protein
MLKAKKLGEKKWGLNKRAETGHWTLFSVQTSLLEEDPHKKKKNNQKKKKKSGIRFDPVWINQHWQFGA